MDDPKATLALYLGRGYETLRWKLDGVSEYDRRRPLVPTGTNLLGVVKHVAFVSSGYFGEVFGRASALPALPEDEPNDDMWATAEESSDYVFGLLDTAVQEAAATVTELDLDSPGHVPWWAGERADVTLHTVLVHMIAELHRHAGQVDIVRELIDGEVGWREGVSTLPDGQSAQWWIDYRDRLQAVAESFR